MDHSDFLKQIELSEKKYQVVDFQKIEETENIKISNLPFSARVILENLLRNLKTSYVNQKHIKTFIHFYCGPKNSITPLIPFFPSRVLMQDFTGVPAVVDLAAMRDAVKEAGLDPEDINPSIEVDLVIDHSVQVDYCKTDTAFKFNVEKEYQRNKERYSLLKWAAKNFKNFRVVPPGSGICHQVNLEYLAKVVCTKKEDTMVAFPDTLIGTDSHTTMINGLGVLGWGVGGIEAEAVMLGEPYYMKLPEIIGVELIGKPAKNITATDIVLMITEKLRAENVVEKIVEFTGVGLKELSLTDRATISNMAPEYGATSAFFPIDSETISYLKKTNRTELSKIVETYSKECNFFTTGNDQISFTKTIKVDLSKIELAIAGPSRPNQRILLNNIEERSYNTTPFDVSDNDEITDGNVLIAAITSCTNTSNPETMIGAGLVAKKAVEKGLLVPNFVKTSLSPGSRVVIDYLKNADLMASLNKLGFNNTGFGCMTCIGNSGKLEPAIEEKLNGNNINTVAVLSGNRNFEARIHQLIKNNYLMSPALVVIFALAGRIDIDFESEPVGLGTNNKPVYFKDLWPDDKEIKEYVKKYVKPEFFETVYSEIFKGDELWDSLKFEDTSTFNWDKNSLYIKKPPFFDSKINLNSGAKQNTKEIKNARCLLVLGDTITTDHISPAGEIPKDYPAGKYLNKNKILTSDFNTYGSRRGNHEIMMRGTFANIRILNSLATKKGGYTLKFPEKTEKYIFDAAMEYKKDSIDLIVFGGKEYGTGSSRDWAAKGTNLLGVKAVIVSSFERIHRSNLIGMGVLPLVFKDNQNFNSLNLNGDEIFTIHGLSEMTPGSILKIEALKTDGEIIIFETVSRLDTEMDLTYYQNGGILNFVLNKMLP
ncbi:MAG: aconitate hydratase AcnA [Desulfobacterales bacterium]|nr:aconitate hydratase AcnA [Desulfobacterales bacterium]